jgi:hypothetical protein
LQRIFFRSYFPLGWRVSQRRPISSRERKRSSLPPKSTPALMNWRREALQHTEWVKWPWFFFRRKLDVLITILGNSDHFFLTKFYLIFTPRRKHFNN